MHLHILMWGSPLPCSCAFILSVSKSMHLHDIFTGLSPLKYCKYFKTKCRYAFTRAQLCQCVRKRKIPFPFWTLFSFCYLPCSKNWVTESSLLKSHFFTLVAVFYLRFTLPQRRTTQLWCWTKFLVDVKDLNWSLY